MSESRIDATDRLRREGRWGEASKYKDEMLSQLRKDGIRRQDAQIEAWKAMLNKYPPLDPEDEEGPLLASDEPWDDMCETSSSNFVSDSMWVYSRIGISGVEPHDAPSAGAWALLQWARKNQDTFFEKLMPRSLQLSEKHLAESRMVAEENVAIASLEEAMAAALQSLGKEKVGTEE